MLMLLVAVMGLSVQSCSKEETKVVNPSNVSYGRGNLANVYYGGKSVVAIALSTSPTEEEKAAVSALNTALNAGDQELKNSGAMTDSQAVKIYKNAMKSLLSGKGYSGYFIIYRYDGDDNEKEIGRITFTE